MDKTPAHADPTLYSRSFGFQKSLSEGLTTLWPHFLGKRVFKDEDTASFQKSSYSQERLWNQALWYQDSLRRETSAHEAELNGTGMMLDCGVFSRQQEKLGFYALGRHLVNIFWMSKWIKVYLPRNKELLKGFLAGKWHNEIGDLRMFMFHILRTRHPLD